MRTELAVLGVTDEDLDAAIAKIEYARGTHAAWRDHYDEGTCTEEHPHVHGRDDQQRIVQEYDRVLKVLTAVRYVTKQEHTVTITDITDGAKWVSRG